MATDGYTLVELTPLSDDEGGRRRPPGWTAQLVWEGLLALALVAVLGWLPTTGTNIAPNLAMGLIAFNVLAATAMAVSLWAGAPNLATGPIAVLTGALAGSLVETDGWSLWPALAVAALLSLPIGLLLGVFAGPLGLPGWAVTFPAALGINAVSNAVSGAQPVPVSAASHSASWLGLAVVVSIGCAALTWTRRAQQVSPEGAPGGMFARSRPPSEPSPADLRPSPLPGTVRLVAMMTSSVLAAVAGMALVMLNQATPTVANAFPISAGVLAYAMIGGASVFGGRMGIAGIVLAASSLSLIELVMAFQSRDNWTRNAVIAVAACVGLVVNLVLQLARREGGPGR